jgi:hypothetical protein
MDITKIVENFPNNLISFIISPPFSVWLLGIKIFFIFISLFLLGMIIFGFLKSAWFNLRFKDNINEILSYKPAGTKKTEKNWKKIMMKLNSGLESEYKLAVIEANNMLEDVLKRMGYSGETITEKLKKVSSDVIPDIEEVKEANAVRNNIVYDPNYSLSLDRAKKIMEVYEKAFKDINLF